MEIIGIIAAICVLYINYKILLSSMDFIIAGNISELLLFSAVMLAGIIILTISSVLIKYIYAEERIKTELSLKKIILEAILKNIVIVTGILILESIILSKIYIYMESTDSLLVSLLGFIVMLISLVAMPIGYVFIMKKNSESEITKIERKIEKEKEREREDIIKERESLEIEKERERAKARKERKSIKRQKEREKEKARKERLIKTNTLYNKAMQNMNNIIYEIDDKTSDFTYSYEDEVSYIYDKFLNLKKKDISKIWLTNDEKLKYYDDFLSELNSSFGQEYYEYICTLINKGRENCERLNKVSREFKNLEHLLYNTSNKINLFDKYIRDRQNYITLDYKGCRAGIEGEERINKELDLYDNIINLQNIRIEVCDNDNISQSIENDNILLTRNGIFVLEVKNFGEIGNYSIIIEKDGRWLKKKKNGQISVFKNVTKQNNRHIGILNKFINQELNNDFDNYIEIEGIVVIANEKVNIENYNENQKIFRDSELYSYIKSKQPIFKKEELDKIKSLILDRNLPPKKYPVFNYYLEILDNIKNLESYLNKYESIVIQLENEYKKYLKEKSSIN